jgi:hypothetical protein
MGMKMLDACNLLPKILDGDGMEEKAHQWEEGGHLAHIEEEHRKMGLRWVDLDGNHIEDILHDI